MVQVNPLKKKHSSVLGIEFHSYLNIDWLALGLPIKHMTSAV